MQRHRVLWLWMYARLTYCLGLDNFVLVACYRWYSSKVFPLCLDACACLLKSAHFGPSCLASCSLFSWIWKAVNCEMKKTCSLWTFCKYITQNVISPFWICIHPLSNIVGIFSHCTFFKKKKLCRLKSYEPWHLCPFILMQTGFMRILIFMSLTRSMLHWTWTQLCFWKNDSTSTVILSSDSFKEY